MIGIKSSGSFQHLESFLKTVSGQTLYSDLDVYGRRGCDALEQSTPRDSGLTAGSWEYKIVHSASHIGLEWYNTNENDGVPIAILIQYGHATGTGGYVSGQDFINPAMRPVFDELANDVWKKVTRA